MERSTTFLEHFAASHFSSADTACDEHLDTFGTNPHGGGDGHLDSPSVTYTALDLTGDGLGDDVGIHLRLLDLVDVDLNILVRYLLELFLEFVDFLSTPSDDDTGTGCLDSDGDELEGPLDDDPREFSLCKTAGEILADLVILGYLLRIAATDPVGVPATGDADSVAGSAALGSTGALTSRMMVT